MAQPHLLSDSKSPFALIHHAFISVWSGPSYNVLIIVHQVIVNKYFSARWKSKYLSRYLSIRWFLPGAQMLNHHTENQIFVNFLSTWLTNICSPPGAKLNFSWHQVVFRSSQCADCGLVGDPRLLPPFCHLEPQLIHRYHHDHHYLDQNYTAIFATQ